MPTALAEAFVTQLAGADPDRMRNWVDEQLGAVDDVPAALRFREWCPVDGVPVSAYQAQILDGKPTILAGIRFKGGDLAQPFVDVLAWDDELQPDLPARISTAFAVFSPRAIRIRWPGRDAPPSLSAAVIDQLVFSAPLSALKTPEVPATRLEFQRVHNLDWYDTFRAEFDRWQVEAGPLRGEVFPADKDDFTKCMQTGAVLCATLDGRWAGTIAARREAERFGHGYCVVEEFLAAAARGRGWGASLQNSLIQALPDLGGDVLWGTISARNVASRRTALRCGRSVVETWWFSPLPC